MKKENQVLQQGKFSLRTNKYTPMSKPWSGMMKENQVLQQETKGNQDQGKEETQQIIT